jgi:hypothetical protein
MHCQHVITDNVKFQRVYDRAMAKVQALSNAVQRSTKWADIVQDVVGLTFLNPTCTRWNSYYYAVRRIVEVGLEKTNQCQAEIGLEKFTDEDMQFLTSYVDVFKPGRCTRAA